MSEKEWVKEIKKKYSLADSDEIITYFHNEPERVGKVLYKKNIRYEVKHKEQGTTVMIAMFWPSFPEMEAENQDKCYQQALNVFEAIRIKGEIK